SFTRPSAMSLSPLRVRASRGWRVAVAPASTVRMRANLLISDILRSFPNVEPEHGNMNCRRAVQDHHYGLTLRGFPAWRAKLAEKSLEFKILSDNRQAGHNYFLMDRYEAGMVLTGTEVKAARDAKVQLKDAYVSVIGNEAWLVNAHISQ